MKTNTFLRIVMTVTLLASSRGMAFDDDEFVNNSLLHKEDIRESEPPLTEASTAAIIKEVAKRYPGPFIGIATGFTSTIACTPIDKLTTNRQVAVDPSRSAFKSILIKPYSGCSIALGTSMAGNMIVFGSRPMIESCLKQQTNMPGFSRDSAGILAGITQAYVVAPLSWLKVRKYTNEHKTLLAIVLESPAKDSFRHLWAGSTAQATRNGCWWGGYFKVKESLEASAVLNHEHLAATKDLLIGGISGFSGTILSYPLDTITKMQRHPVGAHMSILGIIQQVFAGQGVAGFYRGFILNSGLRMVIAGAVINLTDKKIKSFLGLNKNGSAHLQEIDLDESAAGCSRAASAL